MIEKAVKPSSRYREFAPSAPLSAYLVCLWEQTIGMGAEPYRQLVLPDGCIDIIMTGPSKPVIVGPNTRPFWANLPAGSTTIGIRLRPGIAGGLLGLPLNRITDQEIALSLLFRQKSEELLEKASSIPKIREKLALLEGFFTENFGHFRGDDLTGFAVKWLATHPSGRLRDLCDILNIGTRRLHRHFLAAVGYGPKTLQRILRFQGLIQEGRKSPEKNLVELSLAAGYSDQAHMTREFRRLSGMVPAGTVSKIESPLALSDLFKTP